MCRQENKHQTQPRIFVQGNSLDYSCNILFRLWQKNNDVSILFGTTLHNKFMQSLRYLLPHWASLLLCYICSIFDLWKL